MTRTAVALADDDEVRKALLGQFVSGAASLCYSRRQVRADIARQILAQRVECKEHPMPFPKPSCWTCGRNGAFVRAARIADGHFPGTDEGTRP